MLVKPEEIMASLQDAADKPELALAAIMILLANVNDYKINDVIDGLIEAGVIRNNNNN